MKNNNFAFAGIVLANLVALPALAGEPTPLSLKLSNTVLELSWPATTQKADGSVVRPYFELQRTFDFRRWEPIGERQHPATATLGQLLSARQPLDDSKAFYRLLSVESIGVAKLGSGGAEVFGYGDAFTHELQRIGQVSPDQFAAMFPNSASYVPGISWDRPRDSFGTALTRIQTW